MNDSVVERFWSKVNKNGPIGFDETQCWLWTGAPNKPPINKPRSSKAYGYGLFSLGRRKVPAHKFSYELTHGVCDAKLDHRPTCSKLCVNPAHLRPVTHKQNTENRAGANKNSKSGIRGIYWDKSKGKWIIQVEHNGERYRDSFPPDQLAKAKAAVVALRNKHFTHNDLDRQCLHPDILT